MSDSLTVTIQRPLITITAPGPQGATGNTGATGATGANGADGAPGSVWRTGAGIPSNGLGINGDYYLNTASGDVYLKSAGTYSVVANITGPAGDPGPGSSGTSGLIQLSDGFGGFTSNSNASIDSLTGALTVNGTGIDANGFVNTAATGGLVLLHTTSNAQIVLGGAFSNKDVWITPGTGGKVKFDAITPPSGTLTLAGALSATSVSGSGSGLTALSAGNISSGTLAVTRGGTGTSTQLSAGSVVFAGTSGVYSQSNAELFWDNTNNRLGVGTSVTGAAKISVVNATAADDLLKLKGASSQSGNYLHAIDSANADVARITSSGGFYLDKILLECNTFAGNPYFRSNSGRLDFYANNYVIFDSAQTTFTGNFGMTEQYQGAIDAHGQQCGAVIDTRAIGWSGSGLEYQNFYLQHKLEANASAHQFFSITGRNLGGYNGDSFTVHSYNWRTNPYSGSVGLNNNNALGHLDIVEDDPNRTIIRAFAAYGQNNPLMDLMDYIGASMFSINNIGIPTAKGYQFDGMGTYTASNTLYVSGSTLYFYDGVTSINLSGGASGSPGGSTNDIQVNGGGYFAGGGPTWNGSSLTAYTFDTSTGYYYSGVQVVGSQQPAISDDSGGTSDPFDRSIGNAILAALRAHGLIST